MTYPVIDENTAPVRARASTSLPVQSQISTWNPRSAIRRARSVTGSSRNTISAQTARSNIACSSPPMNGALRGQGPPEGTVVRCRVAYPAAVACREAAGSMSAASLRPVDLRMITPAAVTTVPTRMARM